VVLPQAQSSTAQLGVVQTGGRPRRGNGIGTHLVTGRAAEVLVQFDIEHGLFFVAFDKLQTGKRSIEAPPFNVADRLRDTREAVVY